MGPQMGACGRSQRAGRQGSKAQLGTKLRTRNPVEEVVVLRALALALMAAHEHRKAAEEGNIAGDHRDQVGSCVGRRRELEQRLVLEMRLA